MTMSTSGIFTRAKGPKTWQDDAAAGIKIKSDLHDANDNDIADALTLMICKDGRSIVSNDIPMSSHTLTGMREPLAPQEAATRNFVETFAGWTTSKFISGSDANGRLNFTGPTGVNGIGWEAVDMSLVGKLHKANETRKRLVINNTFAATGPTDVFIVDEAGIVNNSSGWFTTNLSHDGSVWRTIAAGWGTALLLQNAIFKFYCNDVATVTNPYMTATMRSFLEATGTAGNAVLTLRKTAATDLASIRGNVGDEIRWEMRLGDGTAESGTAYVGSNFQLYKYNNSGAVPALVMTIVRDTSLVTFYGDMAVNGKITSEGNPMASFYTGSVVGNVDYPIGTILAVQTLGVTPARNATMSVRISTSAGAFDLVSTTVLDGTWRSRGMIDNATSGDFTCLAQRVA